MINNARSYVGADSSQVENMIASLESSRRQAEAELEEASELLKQAEKLHKDLQKQMIAFYEYKDSLYEKAEQEARAIVEKAKKEAEEIIRELRRMRIEKQAEVKEHELIEARRRLDEAAPEKEKTTKGKS